ncbi:MAG: glycosyltransferase [Methanoregula sp.]|nr:MAG: glycosyltransferase [Methanoregula sp.]
MNIPNKTDFRHRLALIVPTRNRPELLIKLLKTINAQEIRPSQVVIVDGSDKPVESQIREYLSSDDTYIHVSPPSLTRQRNEGIKQLHDDITLSGYLDDDIELEPGAIEAMLSFWEQCPTDTGGVGFNIINIPEKKPLSGIIRRIFCIGNPVSGKVLRSGFCTSAFPASQDIPCEWLCGGATIWRREILNSYKYDEWYSGWAYHEDAEFSYRVFKKYQLFVVHKARVTHNPPPFNPAKNITLGKMAVINRYHFVKKNPELSVVLFYWSAIGEVLLNLLQSVWERNRNGFLVARGNFEGIYHIIRGDLVQVDENFRKA